MTNPIWTQANCKGSDPDLFFPETIAEAREAVAICQDCPIRKLCGNYAETAARNCDDGPGIVGIWGGRTFYLEVEGKSGKSLTAALRVNCPRGHPYDSHRSVRGKRDKRVYEVRVCSTCTGRKRRTG